MKKLRNPLLPRALTMLNVGVPSGVNTPPQSGSRRWLRNVVGIAAVSFITCPFALLGGCGKDVTRVRLEFRVENEQFRPDYIDVWWQTGNAKRTARVPTVGSFTSMGPNLGSALISLNDGQPIERRFVARGMRGDVRVSGSVAEVPWNSGRESSVNMTLGCYDDPQFPEPVPGCGPGAPDAGAPDAASGGDAVSDAAEDRPRG
jgi:hypothetical protein